MMMDRINWIGLTSILLVLLIAQPRMNILHFTVSITNSGYLPAQTENVWEIVNDDYVSADVAPQDIVFVNATHGWVLSQTEDSLFNGIILHTRDGGDTWSSHLQNASQR
ncbi:MAG: hypothetical protein E4H14_16685 [Candidatus Thorarchaeota archaeon]|nr:MAG: hypothetical protein E4H14_16685 [Candidatus Thorarchaeota archaeon]